MDQALIATLRRDGRASHSTLAQILGVTRATVRARLAKLEQRGEIVGYSVLVKGDVVQAPVRALTTLAIEGRGIERITRRLLGFSAVQAVHSTSGKWDLVVATGTATLAELDHMLVQIRHLDGVISSETSILLATHTPKRA